MFVFYDLSVFREKNRGLFGLSSRASGSRLPYLSALSSETRRRLTDFVGHITCPGVQHSTTHAHHHRFVVTVSCLEHLRVSFRFSWCLLYRHLPTMSIGILNFFQVFRFFFASSVPLICMSITRATRRPTVVHNTAFWYL